MKFLMTCLTILFLLINIESVLAEKRCIKGSNPSEEKIDKIKLYNANFQKEQQELILKSSQNPEDQRLKALIEQNLKILTDKMSILEESSKAIKLEQDLKECREFSLSIEEFRKLKSDWILMAMHEPGNKEYAYNFKLLTELMMLRTDPLNSK